MTPAASVSTLDELVAGLEEEGRCEVVTVALTIRCVACAEEWRIDTGPGQGRSGWSPCLIEAWRTCRKCRAEAEA